MFGPGKVICWKSPSTGGRCGALTRRSPGHDQAHDVHTLHLDSVTTLRPASWLALVSTITSVVLLAGGWAVARIMHPAYNMVTETISTLDHVGIDHRNVMTVAFVCFGACYVVTAIGLRPAALPGRLLLIIGGIGTMLVTVFPEPAHGTSDRHLMVAIISFSALAAWPSLAWRKRHGAPWPLRPVAGIMATLFMLGLTTWYIAELNLGTIRGLPEWMIVISQALWPLLVTIYALRLPRHRPVPAATATALQKEDDKES